MLNKSISFILLLVCTIWCLNLRDPHLLSIRTFEPFIIISLLAITIVLSKYGKTDIFKIAVRVSAVILIATVVTREAVFIYKKHQILNSPTSYHLQVNRRLIIGFKNPDEIKKLSLNGIAGIFITKRNIAGKSYEETRSFLTMLQEKRKKAGLPPLIIATDQEGGPVSRLSPLIEKQPPLSTLVEEKDAALKAYQYGAKQGMQLKKLGITVNFSPVVDLKPEQTAKLDFHSKIKTRAISNSPQKVIDIALPYIKGLESTGITATLKHFPGLGKVNTDTHHFSARLDTPISRLFEKDWLPFKFITTQSNSWIMLAHVTLPTVDEANPVSTSQKVVDEILRKQIGFDGTLITDDLTMGATYNRGFCTSVINAYNADIDYLLIAYDYEKYYSVMNCLEGGKY